MKALMIAILVLFSVKAWTFDTTPDQMNDEQKAQLIQALNQLEPEMLETLLTEEALDWYIEQFSRGGEYEPKSVDVSTGKVDGIGGFDDPNAPSFL